MESVRVEHPTGCVVTVSGDTLTVNGQVVHRFVPLKEKAGVKLYRYIVIPPYIVEDDKGVLFAEAKAIGVRKLISEQNKLQGIINTILDMKEGECDE